MKIKVSELEKALETLLSELKEQNGEEIELDEADLYWALNKEERYNPYEEPQTFTLGQLSDDLEHISKVAQEELPPVSNDFIKLSAVLRYLGDNHIW